MIIDITGRHVSVTEELKTHAHERLDYVLRHFGEVISAHVILDVEKERSMAEMVVHGRNLTAAVHADGADLVMAIDRAAAKMRHQLEKHHSKVLGKRRKGGPRMNADSAQAAAELAAAAQAAEQASRGTGDAQPAAASAKIVRTKPGRLTRMTVQDAVERLAKDGTGFVVFRDAESAQVGVLYRRHDGNLTLIETGVQ